jgi:hypothetical protein
MERRLSNLPMKLVYAVEFLSFILFRVDSREILSMRSWEFAMGLRIICLERWRR